MISNELEMSPFWLLDNGFAACILFLYRTIWLVSDSHSSILRMHAHSKSEEAFLRYSWQYKFI